MDRSSFDSTNPGSESRDWIYLALVATLMATYTAGYAWSVPNTDTADELMRAFEIRNAIAYPLEGPPLGNVLHVGPVWFYLTALPLWLHQSWLAVAIFIGAICGLKFPLAYLCGSKLLDRRFGLLWAVALTLPTWNTVEQLVFLNPNASSAAILAILALALHTKRCKFPVVLFGISGLAAGLAFHVHPTTLPSLIFVAIAFHFYCPRALKVKAVAAFGIGCSIPFLPYIASQVSNSFADWTAATGYVKDQVSLANAANAPAILLGYLYGGPHLILQYIAKWPAWAAASVGIVVIVLSVVAGVMTTARVRRLFVSMCIALATFAVFIAILRPTTPVQFAWTLAPASAALVALGLWALFRRWEAFFTPGIAIVLAISVSAMFGMATIVRSGEGRLPHTLLDIKEMTPEYDFRDVWFPAHAHAQLGKQLCSMNQLTSVHGHLAYVIDKDIGLDALFACNRRANAVLAASQSDRRLAGMTRAFWRAVDMEPKCWTGSLGITDEVRAIDPGNGIGVAVGDTYLPRRPTGHARSRKQFRFEAKIGDAVLLTNVLGDYEHFRILTAEVNDVPLDARASNRLSALFLASAATDAASRRWHLVVETTYPDAVDVIVVTTAALSAVRCINAN
ncbi:MAG: hypothetical protein ABIQ72_06895 [Usitatibacter sp.]